MSQPSLHRWDVSPASARAIQNELAGQVDVSRPLGDWATLAAVDVSFTRGARELFAAVVVVDRWTGAVIERVGVRADAAFPYVPGLLSFREAPPILEAFAKLRAQPDAVLVDGQGIAHPRRLGLASHLGLWLDLPTIGCAKSRLCGVFTEPGTARGATSPLLLDGAQIGDVVRTRKRCKPLFVSPGHRCDQASATRLVLELAIPFRLPTPTRLAHSFVNDIRKAAT